MAYSGRIFKPGYTDFVPNVPCCMTLALNPVCTLKHSVGDKCGFSAAGLFEPPVEAADFFNGPPPKVFEAFDGTITVHLEVNRDYEAAPEPPRDFGTADCTATFAAHCEDQDGSVVFDWIQDLTEFGIEASAGTPTMPKATDGPTTPPAEANSICVDFAQAFAERSVPHMDPDPFVDARWADEHLPVPTFEPTTVDVPGCSHNDGYKVAINYDQTFTGSAEIDFEYTESASVTGELHFCHPIKTEDLISDVKSSLETTADDCCAEQSLNGAQTHYEYAEVEVRLNFTQPCAGAVRIRYKEITTIQVGDEEPTVTTEDKIISPATAGMLVVVKAPDVDLEVFENQVNTRCVSDFSIEWA